MTAAAPISCNFPFQTGDQIFLKAANQLYLSVIERGGIYPLEAAKANVDVYCQMTVTVVDSWTITLQIANFYLSVIARDGQFPIEGGVKTTPDPFCLFRVVQLCTGANQPFIALLGSNSLYLSEISSNGLNPIWAAKSGIDVYSQFSVSTIT